MTQAETEASEPPLIETQQGSLWLSVHPSINTWAPQSMEMPKF
jgi:hypothetical protein